MTTTRQTTIIVLFSALTVLASMGIRQSFGLFLQPISDSLDLGREVFSLAIALQNVVFGLPLFGMIADRYGARWVVLGGALLYAAGCLLVPASSGPLGLHLTLGLIIGLGLGSTTYVVVLGAVARVVHPANRSTAFGIVTAAGSFGTFALVPGIQWVIVHAGWQASFAVSAALIGWVVLLAFGFPRVLARTRPGRTARARCCKRWSGRGAIRAIGCSTRGSSSAASTSPLSPRTCPRSSPTVACRA